MTGQHSPTTSTRQALQAAQSAETRNEYPISLRNYATIADSRGLHVEASGMREIADWIDARDASRPTGTVERGATEEMIGRATSVLLAATDGIDADDAYEITRKMLVSLGRTQPVTDKIELKRIDALLEDVLGDLEKYETRSDAVAEVCRRARADASDWDAGAEAMRQYCAILADAKSFILANSIRALPIPRRPA